MLDALRSRVTPAAFKGSIPALIDHGGGNTVARARAAVAAAADFVEVDLWVHEGRFEARHERRTVALPLLFEKWSLRFAPLRPYGLSELLANTPPSTGIFLDLKNGGDVAARLVERSIASAGVPHAIVASSQDWMVLRAIRERCPDVGLFYSIDVQAKLDLLFSVARRDPRPLGVSCRHSLLRADIVRRLHDYGLLVVAWTVDNLDRAAQLAAWGADGITTHRVETIRRRLLDA